MVRRQGGVNKYDRQMRRFTDQVLVVAESAGNERHREGLREGGRGQDAASRSCQESSWPPLSRSRHALGSLPPGKWLPVEHLQMQVALRIAPHSVFLGGISTAQEYLKSAPSQHVKVLQLYNMKLELGMRRS